MEEDFTVLRVDLMSTPGGNRVPSRCMDSVSTYFEGDSDWMVEVADE